MLFVAHGEFVVWGEKLKFRPVDQRWIDALSK